MMRSNHGAAAISAELLTIVLCIHAETPPANAKETIKMRSQM
jgi:hypothetical protein